MSTNANGGSGPSVSVLTNDLAKCALGPTDVGADRKQQVHQPLKAPYMTPMSATSTEPVVTAVVQQQATPPAPATVTVHRPYRGNMSTSPSETAGTYEVIPHRVFVGGFALDTQESELRELFERHGQVREVKIIRDTETGVSKGYGFITFETDEEARNIRTSNERLELLGRRLNLGPAMRRIHHNQRYTEMITSPAPIFTAGAFPAFQQQQFVPVSMTVQQATDQGYFITQPYMSAQGVPYVFAMPQQAGQQVYQPYATPMCGAQQPASFAYTPSITPQPYAGLQSVVSASAPGSAYSTQGYAGGYGQVLDMGQQQQQQVPMVSPMSATAPRTVISHTPLRYGGTSSRSARRSIHASLSHNNTDEAINQSMGSQQWPASNGQPADMQRWQQMSTTAASGLGIDNGANNSASAPSAYYAQPLASYSTSSQQQMGQGYGQAGGSAFDARSYAQAIGSYAGASAPNANEHLYGGAVLQGNNNLINGNQLPQ